MALFFFFSFFPFSVTDVSRDSCFLQPIPFVFCSQHRPSTSRSVALILAISTTDTSLAHTCARRKCRPSSLRSYLFRFVIVFFAWLRWFPLIGCSTVFLHLAKRRPEMKQTWARPTKRTPPCLSHVTLSTWAMCLVYFYAPLSVVIYNNYNYSFNLPHA